MIFGLSLEPSITKFGVRMTDLLQTGFFHLINGKINPKNLGKVIKKLKIKKKNLISLKKKFDFFLKILLI